MKVLITGSTGLVGKALVTALAGKGYTVCRLLRPGSSSAKPSSSPPGQIIDVEWHPTTCDLDGVPFGKEQHIVEGADAVVNLAGASIADEPWTDERKALLRSSRIHTTRALVSALEKFQTPPRTLISASAIGYYGNRGGEVLQEESAPGTNFLSTVALEWEGEAIKAEAFGMRVVRARFGIILSKHGGALPQMMQPFRWGVGGKLGSGRQWMSWITLRDVVSVIQYALENPSLSGAVNVVAPQPVQNADFARELGSAMNRPALLPAPGFALRFALGEMADALLLGSERVVPRHLEQQGFTFMDRDLRSALPAVLSEN